MANSITGVNDDIIAMSILEAFTAELTPLFGFSTNFSDEARKKGDKISVLRTIVADTSLDKTTHADYTIQDADSDAVEVVLGQPKYVSWGLDDTEVANSSVVNMEVYGQQKGVKLAQDVLANIWGAITNANYGAAGKVSAAADFDTDDVTDLRGTCTAANMPRTPRIMVLDDAYITNLLKDTSVKNVNQFGDRMPKIEGAIARLSGFDIFESTIIPANGENLVGFCAHPAGMAVAMRYLMPQEGNTYNRAEAFTDPSGIVLGLRDWYDNDSGVRKRVMECVFGKVVGIAAGIKRITSA